jgi:hypothetical protein
VVLEAELEVAVVLPEVKRSKMPIKKGRIEINSCLFFKKAVVLLEDEVALREDWVPKVVPK